MFCVLAKEVLKFNLRGTIKVIKHRHILKRHTIGKRAFVTTCTRRPNIVVKRLVQIVYHLTRSHLIITSRHPEPDNTQIVRRTLRPLRMSKDDMDSIQITHAFIPKNSFPPQ